MQTRRTFALWLSATAAVMSVLSHSGILTGGSSRLSDIAQLSLERMQPWVKTWFRVSHPEGSGELELVRAVALPRHRREAGERFSLVFRGPVDAPLAQCTYSFEHPEAGRFDLFIVPVVSRESGSLRYEAIINREAVV